MILRIQKPQHMGGQGGAGIVPLGIRLQMDPLQGLTGVVCGNELPDPVADLLLHPLAEGRVPPAGPGHVVVNVLGVDLQDLRKAFGQHVLVLLSAHGQLFAVLHPVHQLLGPLPVQLVGVLLDGVGVDEHRVR